MYNHNGEQIKYFREKAGLSRSKFSKKYGISANTLKYLENGQLQLNENRIVFFKNIFTGFGFDFRDSLTDNSTENEINSFSKIDKIDIKIKHEIDFFKKTNSNYVLYTIPNNLMYPIYCIGDIVAGSQIFDTNLYPNLTGSFCIVSDVDDEKFIGRVIKAKENVIHITSYNHDDCSRIPYLEIKNVKSVAQITRHWCLNNLLKTDNVIRC